MKCTCESCERLRQECPEIEDIVLPPELELDIGIDFDGDILEVIA